jgi:hypothetical protein
MKHLLLETFSRILILISFSCSTLSVFGQADPIKFGKVELPDLQMSTYARDTSASAVILCDFGKSYFKYSEHDGFQVYFERQVRLKILKKSGYDWANVQIPFYRKSNSEEEEVLNLKGFTYNLNGKEIVKDKLTKEAVFDEQVSDNWVIKKFTMPNVKEGSVIEFSYTIKSDFWFTFREWQFQESIPVVWSEYRASMLEYFDYKKLSQGYESFTTEVKTVSERISRFNGDPNPLTPQSTVYRWVAKDVPALREEPYMTTIDDYVTKIDFELASVKLPGQIIQPVNNTWQALTENLLKAESFGQQLKRTGFAKEELAAITLKYIDPVQRTAAVYNLVRKQVKWNEIKHKYASSLKKAYEAHTGSSADINLMLVAFLREAGIEASPVILSTRDHGRVLETYALITKFNYVIAHVKINETELLLDATDPVIKPGMLPARCLNGQGWLVSEKNPHWVSLQPSERLARVFTAKLKITPDGDLKGNIDVSDGGYSALAMRKKILSEGKDKYIETVKKEHPEWQIASHSFTDVEEIDKTVNAKYEVTLSDYAQVAGDAIYLKPMLSEAKNSNPFKLDNRLFPVDFAYAMDETYACTFTIPEGYKVEEIPKGAILDLPEKTGRFTYMVAVNGNTIQITSRINLKKPVYYSEEYPYLKEFFSQIVTKHAEQIVIKKSKI